ncbi:MAG: hypothetical protein ACE5D4_05690 [Thermodesulfobacteriota bacterium]
MYEKGEGIVRDYGEAVKWFRKAAEQGNALAQHNLWVMYGIVLFCARYLLCSRQRSA